MSSEFPHARRFAYIALISVIALLVLWRVATTEIDAWKGSVDASHPVPGGAIQQRLMDNPADYSALLQLALRLEEEGKPKQAADAATASLRFGSADLVLLITTANLFLRLGDEATALSILRRMVETHPADEPLAWPVFVSILDHGNNAPFFADVAADDADWWSRFFSYACKQGTLRGLQNAFLERVDAGKVTLDERRCFLARLQLEEKWDAAYQLWMTSLPVDQQRPVGLLFNGRFEIPISNTGFDWHTVVQDGISVGEEKAGVSARKALHVTFRNKPFEQSPIFQYLLLSPGRYRFQGSGRAVALDTPAGIQWGIRCMEANKPGRLLAQSGALLGSSEWVTFDQEFTVAPDCSPHLIHLETAAPRPDAAPVRGEARLKGHLWYDDLKIARVDTEAGSDLRPTGVLRKVDGTVLVGQRDGFVPASRNQEVRRDTQVITGSRSSALLNIMGGCDVELKQNQRIAVTPLRDCKKLEGTIRQLSLETPDNSRDNASAAVPQVVIGEHAADAQYRMIGRN